MASLVVGCGGRATFSMPLGMVSVVSIPSGISLVMRKPGVAMLIRCRRGSFALMMHFGAW